VVHSQLVMIENSAPSLAGILVRLLYARVKPPPSFHHLQYLWFAYRELAPGTYRHLSQRSCSYTYRVVPCTNVASPTQRITCTLPLSADHMRICRSRVVSWPAGKIGGKIRLVTLRTILDTRSIFSHVQAGIWACQ